MGPRAVYFVLSGALIGLLVGLLSPSIYVTRAHIETVQPGGFGVPANRITTLLRRSVTKPEESQAFRSCYRSLEDRPQSRSLSGEWESVRFDTTRERASALDTWSLSTHFVKNVGYGVVLYTHGLGDARPILEAFRGTLECWVESFNERESSRRGAKLELELDRIADLMQSSLTQPIPGPGEAPSMTALIAEIRSLEADLGKPDPRHGPSDNPGFWLDRLNRLEEEKGASGLTVEIRALRAELLLAAELLTRGETLRAAEELATQRQLIAAYARIYRTPELLPAVGQELIILEEEKGSKVWPWPNTLLAGFLLGLLLNWLWKGITNLRDRSPT